MFIFVPTLHVRTLLKKKTSMNNQLDSVAKWYAQGQIFAYPTEAVFGLGCDPQNKEAVYKILELKNRPVEKGMILIASDFNQIAPYIRFNELPEATQQKVLNSWPGPVTWLLPKSDYTPDWVSGDSSMVAIRITAHPLVRLMCEHLQQPIISTSANPATADPAKTPEQLRAYFGNELAIVSGELGKQTSPSKIFHSLTLETIRT